LRAFIHFGGGGVWEEAWDILVLGRMDDKGKYYDHELSYCGIERRDELDKCGWEYTALSV
jgi:hypothetical protein